MPKYGIRLPQQKGAEGEGSKDSFKRREKGRRGVLLRSTEKKGKEGTEGKNMESKH